MSRFHDSRFKGVRLVCRLRRNSSAPAPGVPTGPAALLPAVTQAQSASEAIQQNREVSSKAEESARLMEGTTKINDKYFIVKSLTVEDLELSARNGIWATQSHNEDALNKAFEVCLVSLPLHLLCGLLLFYRPSKTFTSFFLLTSQVNTLVTPAWRLPSTTMQQQTSNGLLVSKRSQMTRNCPGQYPQCARSLLRKVASSTILLEGPFSGRQTRRIKSRQ